MNPLPRPVDGGAGQVAASLKDRSFCHCLLALATRWINNHVITNTTSLHSKPRPASSFVVNQPKGGCVAPNFYRYNRRRVAGFWWTSKGRKQVKVETWSLELRWGTHGTTFVQTLEAIDFVKRVSKPKNITANRRFKPVLLKKQLQEENEVFLFRSTRECSFSSHF